MHQDGIEEGLEKMECNSIVSDWVIVLTEPDMDERIEKINAFIRRYAYNPSEVAKQYLDKAQAEINRISDEREVCKDWIDARQDNTILGYVDFITKHPDSDYSEEADCLIQEMKGDILIDMKRVPFKYDRNMMYDYISNNALTMSDLVSNTNVLTNRAYRHIKCYPRLIDEQKPLPIYSIDYPEIINGNVDVLFFGVSGSGGKTCLMASIMSLVGESTDFLYQEQYNNKECDNIYGQYLADYLKTNILPPATDQYYIQVVNTLIKCNGNYKGTSFIEFAGEQVASLAGNSSKEGLLDGGISPCLIKILNNQNRKIIFVTLDPTNLKHINIEERTENLWVNQSGVLSRVISHFKNAPQFMSKVIGFHTIVSKSDTWLKGSYSTSIHNAIEQMEARGLLLQIEQLCKKYNINNNIDPIPFSIGKFMVGNTYEFDNSDAKKLLQIIKNDIEKSENHRSILSRLRDYFNS